MRSDSRDSTRGIARLILGAIAFAVVGTVATPAQAVWVYREIGDD